MTHCLSNQVEKTRGREHHALGRGVFYAPSPDCRTPSSAPSFAPLASLPPAMPFSILPPQYSPPLRPAPAPTFSIFNAPTFPILPPRTPTDLYHPPGTNIPHPAVRPAHQQLPSSRPNIFPPRFPARFRPAKKKFEKTSKKCKKGVDKSGKRWYYIKAVCERTAAAAAAAPLPHSGRTLKIKQCMTERNT